MTSKLGRINEAVRRRINGSDSDCNEMILIKTWRGESIITIRYYYKPPSEWGQIVIQGSNDPHITEVYKLPLPAGYVTTREVAAADILALINSAIALEYEHSFLDAYHAQDD